MRCRVSFGSVATGQVTNSTEAVYVLDAEVGRIVAYALDRNSNRLALLDGIDLRELAARKAPARGTRKRGRR